MIATSSSSSIADALSTLSDRGLRRLLGARTFLRGLDYEKRKVVGDLKVSQSDATARIKGSDTDPYSTTIQLGGDGISSKCSCPAFQKTGHHCKHVAALLITVRNQARAQQPPRREPLQAAHPAALHQPPHQQQQQPTPTPAPRESKPSRRRERRRRTQAQPVQTSTRVEVPSPDAAARLTGLGAWLAPD